MALQTHLVAVLLAPQKIRVLLGFAGTLSSTRYGGCGAATWRRLISDSVFRIYHPHAVTRIVPVQFSISRQLDKPPRATRICLRPREENSFDDDAILTACMAQQLEKPINCTHQCGCSRRDECTQDRDRAVQLRYLSVPKPTSPLPTLDI
eukprot:COSAG01_NODE_166_length_23296_cov_140.506014_16_plen_150_part_00